MWDKVGMLLKDFSMTSLPRVGGRKGRFCILLDQRGFTFIEILVVVLVFAAMATLAYPSVFQALVRAKGAAETQNLQMIELAKSAFATENPGVPITSFEDLASYLPDNRIPVSPWGTEYLDWDKLEKTTRSMANGYPQFEPDILPLDANGYNDLVVPGYVSLVPLEPDSFLGFPTADPKFIME